MSQLKAQNNMQILNSLSPVSKQLMSKRMMEVRMLEMSQDIAKKKPRTIEFQGMSQASAITTDNVTNENDDENEIEFVSQTQAQTQEVDLSPPDSVWDLAQRDDDEWASLFKRSRVWSSLFKRSRI